MGKSLFFVMLASVWSMGCGTETATPRVDAGAHDAGLTDANALDAALIDASDASMDASSLDASLRDAAVEDASFDLGAMDRHLPRGSVTVRSSVHPGATEGYATASFVTATPEGACIIAYPHSGCVYTSCPSTVSTLADSGEITITGGSSGVLLFPNVEHVYNVHRDTTSLWTGGETITITSDGNDDEGQAPSFSTALFAPSEVTITEPVVSFGHTIAVHRSEDFHIAWTGASQGELVFELSVVDSGTHTLTCRYPLLAESANIPASALSVMPPSGLATLQIRTEDSELLEVEDWEIRVNLRSVAYFPDDLIAAQMATID